MLAFISMRDKPLFKELILLEQLFLITKSQNIFLGLNLILWNKLDKKIGKDKKA